jgi:hypothetical protein
MIWDEAEQKRQALAALHAHLLDLLAKAGAEPSRATCREAAHVVSVQWADRMAQGVPETDLCAGLSRALWGVGETEAASRLVDHYVAAPAVRDTLLRLLASSEVSAALWHAVVRGVVRCRPQWVSAAGSDIWVLDGRQLDASMWTMDLMWRPAVDELVAGMAPVWDATDGAGLVAVIEPVAVKALTAGRLADEVAYRLTAAQAARGWGQRPRVQRW